MSTEEKKVYTIEDVARELGVSKTTVSRAISGKGRISAETRRRVNEFIEAHDYRPNVMAKGLAQSKTYNIGLVLPTGYDDTDFPFFRECMSGICATASENNYDVVVCMTDGQDLSQLHRQIANRKVDGFIISRSITDFPVQELLHEKSIPFVVIGPSDEEGVVNVDNHNQEGSRELTGLLLMKGLTKLALFGGKGSHKVTQSRYMGFREAHEERGIPIEISLVFMEIDNHFKAMKASEQALEAGADAIVCMDDYITGLVLSCLREKGVPVPAGIRIASMYDSVQLEYNTPPVTSLWFDTKELGKSACRLLLRQLGEPAENIAGSPSYQLILRDSTK